MKTFEEQLVDLERQVIIGMLISVELGQFGIEVLKIENTTNAESRVLMQWSLEHYEKHEFPLADIIEETFEERLSDGQITDEEGDAIALVLSRLSKEQEKWKDKKVKYIRERIVKYANYAQLLRHRDDLEDDLDSLNVEEALERVTEFQVVEENHIKAISPFSDPAHIKAALDDSLNKPLFHYRSGGIELDRFMQGHLFRGGFLVFLAQNKGGKSFILADAAIRAAEQGVDVLMYQAGDMDEAQMLRRMAIYSAAKSNLKRYCGPLNIPIMDCQLNQTGTCEQRIWINQGQSEFPFESQGDKFFKEGIEYDVMAEAFENYEEHKPCFECLRSDKGYMAKHFKGNPWWKIRKKVDPLDEYEFKRMFNFGKKRMYSTMHAFPNIRLITHANETLTTNQINADMTRMYKKDGWKAGLLVTDYMDLLAPDRDTIRMQPRDQENKKWGRYRKLTHDWDLLGISASQSDADGFFKGLLDKKNFSEDRRKLDHVTGMIGLNMTLDEKRIGIMRWNEIVARETSGTGIVHVLHRLEMGQPIMGSYL